MSAETLTIGILAVVIVSSVIAAVGVVVLSILYLRMLRMFDHVTRDEKRLQYRARTASDKARKKAWGLVESARDTSLHILEDSEQKAQEIITNAQNVSDQLSRELTNATERAVAAHIEAYKQALKQTQEQTVAQMQSATEQIEHNTQTQLEQHRHALDERFAQTQEKLTEQTKQQYAVIAKRLGEYEKAERDRIAAAAQKAIAAVAGQMLRNQLTQAQHEELIMRALEQAKQELHAGDTK